MIGASITISLVPEARGGPFVFWEDLAGACRSASQLGFHAVEIFAPGPEQLAIKSVRPLLQEHNLKLAAVGTGAGWVKHKVHLSMADADGRRRAREFVRTMIDAGAELGAPAIIGSMQGKYGDGVSREAALAYLSDALGDLGGHSAKRGTVLLFEPLNRFETNLTNTLDDGVNLIKPLAGASLRLLADLFHENIEEPDMAASIRAAGRHIGHVHFVDSNRRPVGAGHIDIKSIATALKDVAYSGYVSAECLPWPDSNGAARMTIEAYNKYFKC